MAKTRAVPGLRIAGSAQATWDIGSTGTLVTASTTVAVPNVQIGDVALVSPSNPASGTAITGFLFRATVTAPSVVTVYATNCTTGTVDPASTIVNVIVFRP